MVRRDPRTGRADRPRTDYTHRPVGRRGDHLGGARIWAERIGGVQSDHTRQVAAVAAKLGLTAVLVQESWVDWPDAVNDKVGNALDQVRAAGGTPYPIPAF